MSTLDEIRDAAQDAASTLMVVASGASTLEQLGLSRDDSVRLEVQLLDRLREVADSLSEFVVVVGGRRPLGGVSGTPRGESVVEPLIDVHDSPSVGGPDAATSVVPVDPTVGEAPGEVPFGSPGAPSGVSDAHAEEYLRSVGDGA